MKDIVTEFMEAYDRAPSSKIKLAGIPYVPALI